MEKRGHGLHHVAVDVLNLDECLLSIASSGWLLHPISVRTIKQAKTAYLCRPGFPALIEVQEQKELKERPLFVKEIFIPVDQELLKLAKFIGLECIVKIATGAPAALLDEKLVEFRDLI